MRTIGTTIRSANTNAITPENEMPPAHSTAASGMFPTEQTKASAATIGPTTTFSSRLQRAAAVGDEESVEEVHRQQRDVAGDQEAAEDLLPEHLHVAAEVVRDRRPRLEREQLRAVDSADACACPACAADRVLARLLLEPPRDEQPHADPHQHDQDEAADELGERELPAEEDPHDDPELEHEIRRTRTGTPSPPRSSRPSGTATSRSRSPRSCTTTTPRRGRWRARPRARPSRRARAASAPAAPTPARYRTA